MAEQDNKVVAEAVELALSRFLKDSSPDAMGLRELAAAKHVLPLYCDIGGCLAIDASGQILCFDWNTPDVFRVEEDPLWRRLALFQGSRKHPEIQCLVPQRPSDAETCPLCGGTGTPKLPEPFRNVVCRCGGIGWLPRGG